MAQKIHNISTPNDGLGDELREAFNDQNLMNTEFYDTKVDKVTGKGLSTNDYDNAEKAKVDAINPDAEQNIQSDWNELDPAADSFIIGKPILETREIIVSAIWTSGLTFAVSANAFPINNISYPATPADVTLDAADATLDRIDLIVAIKPASPATVGSVGFIKGTPATTVLVVPPDFDPSTYYVIKQITVKAAATEPENTSTTQIYNEGTEWVPTYSANLSQTTTDPSTGVNCIEAVNSNELDSVVFKAPAPISTETLSLLTFDFKLKETAISRIIYIEILLAGVRIRKYTFVSGENGYFDQDLAYQAISIDKSKFNLPITNFDEIRISPYFSTTGYFIDNVVLHTGSGSETIPDSGIPEAPEDSILYGRKNKAWEAIPAASADMTKAVYDPNTIEGDAFSMANMIQPSATKSTPIDADVFSIWDSAASFVSKKITWANIKTALSSLYAPKFGTRITNATVTGSYVINHNSGNDWKLTLTGNTTFSESNLPTGVNTIEFTMKITGSFTPTFPTYWDVLGDTYDGSKWNFIAVQIHNGTTSSEEATVFISNI